MYKWDFDSYDWTNEESKQIEEIKMNALRLFNYRCHKQSLEIEIQKNISDKLKIKTYKGHSREELIQKYNAIKEEMLGIDPYFVEQLIGVFAQNEIEIDNTNEVSDACRERLLDDLEKLLENSTRKPSTTECLLELISFIKELSFTTVTLGEHKVKNNKSRIIIYMKAIEYYNAEDRKDVLVEQVLVHELFHAMHYKFSESNIKRTWIPKDTDRINKRAVKESLADAFSFYYLCDKAHPGNAYQKAKEVLIQEWKRHRFPNYPYSGALVFLYGLEKTTESYYNGDDLFDNFKNVALVKWYKLYTIIEEAYNVYYKQEKHEFNEALMNGYEAGKNLYKKIYNPVEFIFNEFEKKELEMRSERKDSTDSEFEESMNKLHYLLNDLYMFSEKTLDVDKILMLTKEQIIAYSEFVSRYNTDLLKENRKKIMSMIYSVRSLNEIEEAICRFRHEQDWN